MDIADIKRKAQAAREATFADGALSFVVRLPTRHEVEVSAMRARLHDGEPDPAQLSVVRRRLLESAVVQWAGVTCEHLAPGAGDEPAELSAEAVAVLLDSNPELAEKLDAHFVGRMAARNSQQAEAEKN